MKAHEQTAVILAQRSPVVEFGTYARSDELNSPMAIEALMAPSVSATMMVNPFARLMANTTDQTKNETNHQIPVRSAAVFAANSWLNPNSAAVQPVGVRSSEISAKFDQALAVAQRYLIGAP